MPRPILRRVIGDSMLPTLPPGRIVVGLTGFRRLREHDIVVVRHGGLEKIKRIGGIRNDCVYLVGDNAVQSTDSRSFGWLSRSVVFAKIVWPRITSKTKRP